MFVLRGFILFRWNHFGSKTYICVLSWAFIWKKNRNNKELQTLHSRLSTSNQYLGFYCWCLGYQIFNLHSPSHPSRLASGNAGSKSSEGHHRALRTFLSGFCSTSTSTSFHWHFVIFDWLIWCIYRGHCEFFIVFGILAFLDQHFQKGRHPISGRRLDTGGTTSCIIRSFSRRLDWCNLMTGIW